jgi:hypothetical protein
VGIVGPCLAICNEGGKDGFPPLDMTPAPCLNVTPLCHIKEGIASARTQTGRHGRGHASARSLARSCGRAHDRRILL